ncbi:MAG: hypothetical protein ABL862_01055 [Candidatus Nitrotoga sp.]
MRRALGSLVSAGTLSVAFTLNAVNFAVPFAGFGWIGQAIAQIIIDTNA